MGVDQTDNADELRHRLLESLAGDGGTATTLAQRLGLTEEAVRTWLWELARAGLVEGSADGVALTAAGHLAARQPRDDARSPMNLLPPTAPTPNVDLNVGMSFQFAWSPGSDHRAQQEEAAREALLASDADRDAATHLLSDAFAQGRLDRHELEERTARALSARTQGDLDEVLQGLHASRPSGSDHPARKAVFWVMAVLTSPFVFFGSMFLLFGSDLGDHVAGLVMLVLFVPGLLALRRWAWPRS